MHDERRYQLACQIVELAKASVLVDAPYLSAIIGRLEMTPLACDAALATDGRVLAINEDRVIREFVERQAPPEADLLHTLLHCVFLHPFVDERIFRGWWDLACDIVVERVMADVGIVRPGERGEAIAAAIELVGERVGEPVTAERVFHALSAGEFTDKTLAWEPLFASDSHELWYVPRDKEEDQGTDPDDGNDPDAKATGDQDDGGTGEGDGEGESRKEDPVTPEQLREGWEKAARRLANEIAEHRRSQGESAGAIADELIVGERKPVDYREFLRQFSVPDEVVRISPDEFDPIFYTFGLNRYGNLPLIEPLEWREEKRVREFVIVLDTSGSVQGEIVRRFVETTYDVFNSEESFFDKVNIHIIQCDERIQKDDVIRSMDDLKAWYEKVDLYGFGGTDFRPAFEYVDKLIRQGAFSNLGGLIYFTDGWGIYPSHAPGYKTAFVFYDQNHKPEAVPPWAIEVTLDDTFYQGGPAIESGQEGAR